jgi:putative ABC transport system permease protein
MRAVVRAGWAAVRRRRLQSLVIGAVVLLSSGTAVLALGLLVASNAPFDRAFTRQHGAHATANFDAAKVSGADLAATADRPGVTAAAGPFDAVRAQLLSGSLPLPTGLIVDRADAASTVDRLDLTDGTWLTGPGQIVLSRDAVGDGGKAFRVGSRITVDVAGTPTLQVVGIADSVTGTADAWVWPAQTDVLHAQGAAASRQMLYRFASAGSDAAIRASLNEATAALPDDALTGASTYLTAKLRAEDNLKPMVPFVVAFAVLGLVMSVLIVVNVVAGAVVAGFRTIGVQKTLGFTPGQVVGVYAGQVLAVCVPACLLGVTLGWLLARPLLAQTADAYAVSGPATRTPSPARRRSPPGPTWWCCWACRRSSGWPPSRRRCGPAGSPRCRRSPSVAPPAAAGASGSGAHSPPPGCPGRSASAWARRPPGPPALP